MTKKKRSDIVAVECVNCHERSEVNKRVDQCPHCKCTGCLLEHGRIEVKDHGNN